MNAAPAVSVIIPNYNGAALLRDCLPSLAAQTFRPFEVVVVDNASRDESEAVFAAWEPPAGIEKIWLPQATNLGFAGAINRGVAAARGELIAPLNNDTEADPGWLQTAVEFLADRPEIGWLACRLIRFADRQTVDTAGHGFTLAGAGYARLRWAQTGGADLTAGEVFGACPAAAVYRRAALADAGPLDEDFFMYYEDLDLDCRLQLAGWRCWYLPESLVYHKVSASAGGAGSPMIVRLSSRNQEWTYLKNFPGALFWALLPIHLLYNLGRFAVYCLKGRGGPFLRGKWEVVGGLGKMLAKRREIQARRRIGAGQFLARLDRAWFRRHFIDHLLAARRRDTGA